MKRFLSILTLICLVCTLVSCAPDNIVTPEPQTQPETQDNNKTPEQDNTQTQTPAPEPEPEPAPAPAPESTPAPAKTKKNEDVKPTFDIDTLDYLTLKTKDLKDKTISFYVGNGAFNAGALTETEWFTALKEAYGVNIDYKFCADSALYSSQLIAQKSGKQIDLVYTKVTDISGAINLAKPATELVTQNASNPFSDKVYKLTGNRFFSGKGNAKMLWYNKAIVKESPLDNWTFDDFVKIATEAKKANNAVLETGTFAELYSCGSDRMTGFDLENGYIMNAHSEQATAILADFADAIKIDNTDGKAFIRGNVAFAYTDLPTKKNVTLGFAPLPRYGEDGTNVVSLSGYALGLSKTVTAENQPAALTFAMLWSARYSESREDSLLFDLGLDSDLTDKYISLCEQSGAFYSADRHINSAFSGNTIPEEYITNVSENQKLSDALHRAQIINTRLVK